MLHKDLTINDFENELKNIIENNLLAQADNYNIARLREEFRKVISKAKHFNIDISDMFPIVAKCGYDYELKFNYNGSVFSIERNYATMLFDTYGSDSICQDK